MKHIHKYNSPFALLLFIVLYIILWPLYKYIFDVDGVGYGMAARRLAAGDLANAVNGYWSPLHSWLIVPFFKFGAAEATAFKLSNGFIGIASIFVFNSLLKKFELRNDQRTPILFASVILLLHYCYFQLAADVLLLPFFLLYVNLVVSKNFFYNLKLQLLAAVVATLCYLAKAYAFPLLLLLHVALFMHHWYMTGKLPWKNLLLFFAAFFLLCLPWIMILTNKYQFFTIGTAGKLNWSWYLGGVVHTENFFHVPAYQNSTSWWEDPYWASNNYLTMFSSFDLFLHQFRVLAFNTQALLKTYAEISIFSAAIILWLFIKSMKRENHQLQKLFLITILFPTGYLLNHIETRFFWVFGFLFLITGTIALRELLNKTELKPNYKLLITFIFYLSFLIEPINSLKDTANTGKEVYELAAHFKNNFFKGNFASNTKQGECEIAAFLSGSKFYFRANSNFNYPQLKAELKKKNINTYLFFYNYEYEKESALSAMGTEFRVTQTLPGLLIFSLGQ